MGAALLAATLARQRCRIEQRQIEPFLVQLNPRIKKIDKACKQRQRQEELDDKIACSRIRTHLLLRALTLRSAASLN